MMYDRIKRGTGNMDDQVHLYFSIIYRHGRVMHNKAMEQFGLTGQQMGYLKYINENPGISQEEIARHLQIDKGAVAKSVRDMMDKGYVSRQKNPLDKRAYRLFATEKAVEIHEEGKKCFSQFERKLTEGMTDEEIELFKILLGKVTDNIVKMLEGGKI